jgi:histidinol phosphatase-like PHP family hydrolase
VPVSIAVISDLHFVEDGDTAGGARCGDIADILFLRAVHRFNRMIRPDVTVLLGDLLNDGDAPAAPGLLARMRNIADLVAGPVIAIPGNHDGSPDAFYSAFDRPGPFVDIEGVRFLPFVDPEEPGYNARRTRRDLDRMAEARAGFGGPIVALQHVPIFPPGASYCPYNYTNADEVIAAMGANGIGLAISGHYHAGMDLIRSDGVGFLAAPAASERPFGFLEVVLDGDDIRARTHALQMPKALALVDTHVHTQFAYCSENMDVAMAMRLAEDFGLAGMAFTEHSGQLYFDNEAYWRGECLAEGIRSTQGRQRRMDDYVGALNEAECPENDRALEVDCDFNGDLVLDTEDRARFSFLTGAVHHLQALDAPEPDMDAVSGAFLATLQRFLDTGIRVLAHPFRVFRRAGAGIPAALFEPTVRLLREHGVAAEINFHTNEPPHAFFRLCIEEGVKLTLGSDAHNLYEVGEFAPHLALLEACGFDGDLDDILLDPRQGGGQV